MSVSVFFVLLVLIVFYKLRSRRIKRLSQACKFFFVLRLVIELNFGIGYAFRIGSVEVSYDSIISLILCCLAVILIIKELKIPRVILIIGGLLILSLLVGLGITVIYPYEGRVVLRLNGWDQIMQGKAFWERIEGLRLKNFLELFNLLKWMLMALILQRIFKNRDELVSAISTILNASTLMIVCGYTEFLCEKILHSELLSQILTFVFGSIHNVDKIGDVRVQGMMLEPSYYSYAAFQLALLSICRLAILKENIKREKNRFVAIMLVMLLSKSFSSVIYFILLLFTFGWFVLGKNKVKLFFKKVALTIPISFIVLLSIWFILRFQNNEWLNYFVERFQRLFKTINLVIKTGGFGTFNSSSEAVRLISILESLLIFLKRPLFGLGIGFVECHSTIVSVMVSGGIIGLFLWLAFVDKVSGGKRRNKVIYLVFVFANICIGSIGFIYSAVYLFIFLCYSTFFTEAKTNKIIALS